jgi:hypothetical protein
VSKLYIENSVGRSVTDAFNKFRREHCWEAVFQHDMHPQMQQRQIEDDGWWIRDVAAKGFAIVSCDLAIVEGTTTSAKPSSTPMHRSSPSL